MVSVMGLMIAMVVMVFSINQERRLYRNAVVCSATQAWVTNQRAAKFVKGNNNENRKIAIGWVNDTLTTMRRCEMYDKKSAIFISSVNSTFSDSIKDFSEDNQNYIISMTAKWHGKELGFPDRW